MRRLFIVIALMLLLFACTKQIYNKKYYYIEPYKGWELVFILNSDSTFILEDKFGCEQFEFSGVWDRDEFSFLDYECFVLEDTCVCGIMTQRECSILWKNKELIM